MPLHAGFAQIDITPPMGTAKIGWLKMLRIQRVLDPLFARAAVFACQGQAVGFISVDLLSIRWSTVERIRQGISQKHGVPGSCIMVGATHTHGGPAVACAGDVPRDDAYVATLIDRCVNVFGQAWQRKEPAQVGLGRTMEYHVAFNRRVVCRDGTVKTHGSMSDPLALCLESPLDPEVGVVAARSPQGRPLGVMVNFACHPTHEGGSELCTAGFPGVMAHELKDHGWPVALYLQGAAGDQHTSNPAGEDTPMEKAGQLLARDVVGIIHDMAFENHLELGCAQRRVDLPYREATPEQIQGSARGAQRFVDPSSYDRAMPGLLQRIAQRGVQPAQVQALRLGRHVLVSIPAEYFAGLGLWIKQQAHPRHAWVVAYANGMVGYVPTRQAFEGGGYETTFAPTSRLAPQAGELLAQAAVEAVRET